LLFHRHGSVFLLAHLCWQFAGRFAVLRVLLL
jgi:hypothetical protein